MFCDMQQKCGLMFGYGWRAVIGSGWGKCWKIAISLVFLRILIFLIDR